MTIFIWDWRACCPQSIFWILSSSFKCFSSPWINYQNKDAPSLGLLVNSRERKCHRFCSRNSLILSNLWACCVLLCISLEENQTRQRDWSLQLRLLHLFVQSTSIFTSHATSFESAQCHKLSPLYMTVKHWNGYWDLHAHCTSSALQPEVGRMLKGKAYF